MGDDDLKNFEKDAALDKIADNLTDALSSAAAGYDSGAQHHIGKAAADIIELSNIVKDTDEPGGST